MLTTTPKRWRQALWLALAGLTAVGCSDYSNIKPPTTYKVRGKVMWANGKPLAGGRITFHPKVPANSEAFAEIERDGTFTLATFSKDDGAMPGGYRVSLDPYSYKTGAPRQMIQLPQIYSDPRTSGLEAEVATSDNELAAFVVR